MSLIYTEIKPKGKARYEIQIDWEHGDADLTTNDKHTLLGNDDGALLAWVAQFRECKTAIDNARWYSAPFSREEWEEKLGMELAYDKIYDGCSNPPSASIGSIIMQDESGKRFKVTGY